MRVLWIVLRCRKLWHTRRVLHRGVLWKLQRVNLSHFGFFRVLAAKPLANDVQHIYLPGERTRTGFGFWGIRWLLSRGFFSECFAKQGNILVTTKLAVDCPVGRQSYLRSGRVRVRGRACSVTAAWTLPLPLQCWRDRSAPERGSRGRAAGGDGLSRDSGSRPGRLRMVPG